MNIARHLKQLSIPSASIGIYSAHGITYCLLGLLLTRYLCSAAAGSENAALTAEVLLMQERCRLSEERALADQVRTVHYSTYLSF